MPLSFDFDRDRLVYRLVYRHDIAAKGYYSDLKKSNGKIRIRYASPVSAVLPTNRRKCCHVVSRFDLSCSPSRPEEA